jgi:hypothetical protein
VIVAGELILNLIQGRYCIDLEAVMTLNRDHRSVSGHRNSVLSEVGYIDPCPTSVVFLQERINGICNGGYLYVLRERYGYIQCTRSENPANDKTPTRTLTESDDPFMLVSKLDTCISHVHVCW